MKLLLWNIRGCNKPHKQKELKSFLLKNKVDIIGLFETRVKADKFKMITEKLNSRWEYLHNDMHAENGRIWVGWNPRTVDVKLITQEAQGILCELTNLQSGNVFSLVAVYAYNTNEKRKSLWRFLDQVKQQVQGPLLIGGDFNSLLSSEDRLNGNQVTEADTKDFVECLERNLLNPVQMTGDKYTWCNQQAGERAEYSL